MKANNLENVEEEMYPKWICCDFSGYLWGRNKCKNGVQRDDGVLVRAELHCVCFEPIFICLCR